MRAHQCLCFNDIISLSRDTSLVVKDYWDLLRSWESPERDISHFFDPMRAHKCPSLKDRISPTRNPLETLALKWEASWDLLGLWEVAPPTSLTWCVLISVTVSKIGSLLTLYLENCQALYTPKSANSIPLWGPIFCSVGGGRLHVIYLYKYICFLIYLGFFLNESFNPYWFLTLWKEDYFGHCGLFNQSSTN